MRAHAGAKGSASTAAVKGLIALLVCVLYTGGYRDRIAARECSARSHIRISGQFSTRLHFHGKYATVD